MLLACTVRIALSAMGAASCACVMGSAQCLFSPFFSDLALSMQAGWLCHGQVQARQQQPSTAVHSAAAAINGIMCVCHGQFTGRQSHAVPSGSSWWFTVVDHRASLVDHSSSDTGRASFPHASHTSRQNPSLMTGGTPMTTLMKAVFVEAFSLLLSQSTSQAVQGVHSVCPHATAQTSWQTPASVPSAKACR